MRWIAAAIFVACFAAGLAYAQASESPEYTLGRADGITYALDAMYDPTPDGCVGGEEFNALRAKGTKECPTSAAEFNAFRTLFRVAVGRCVGQ